MAIANACYPPIPDFILIGADQLEEGGKLRCMQNQLWLNWMSPEHQRTNYVSLAKSMEKRKPPKTNWLNEFSHKVKKKRKFCAWQLEEMVQNGAKIKLNILRLMHISR